MQVFKLPFVHVKVLLSRHIMLIEGIMVTKLDKVLCYKFLFTFLTVHKTQ